MLKIATITVLLLISISAVAQDEQIEDQLVWDYSEFVMLFEEKNWKELEKFIVNESKFSFGGDHAVEGFKSIYAKNDSCYADLLFSLKQGCKKTNNGGYLGCISPPQFSEPNVVYLGARAGFIYSENRKKWVVDFAICGGD